ncbi:hypothetical protein OV203_11430 [Nannocystis sp. ILAH1]|uniref:hypothetical protein n=1 Tax=unclassified Nannocystis TaxID=2627009 RepID=UPI00226E73DA|nr:MULTISPECIES: hypothetical protein [unclassified Nannocystis]MCY0987740.1 hypothetical protein [Nannocystis sp. ILAH1]MCY1070459.1 hypothetical protein [Nannocystis sp. RBIL2]
MVAENTLRPHGDASATREHAIDLPRADTIRMDRIESVTHEKNDKHLIFVSLLLPGVALAATKATGIWEGIAYNADGLADLDYEARLVMNCGATEGTAEYTYFNLNDFVCESTLTLESSSTNSWTYYNETSTPNCGDGRVTLTWYASRPDSIHFQWLNLNDEVETHAWLPLAGSLVCPVVP